MAVLQPTDLYTETILTQFTPEGGIIPDPDAPRPVHLADTNGVTLDTRGIPGDRIGVIAREFGYGLVNPAFASRPRIQPGRQIVVRYHLQSMQNTTVQPYIRMRARTARFAWSQSLDIGGAQNAGTVNRVLAQEVLPGVGTGNPDRRPGVNNGGWYSLLMVTPFQTDIRPEFSSGTSLADRMPGLTAQPGPGVDAPSIRDVRVALDIADSISFSPEAATEQGLVTLDRIEIYDVPELNEF
jgi:hypothetical protein